MDIPITGLLYESDDQDGNHSHMLYITSWDGRAVHAHAHAFAGITSFDVGHSHEYAGVTAPAPTGVPHVHEYQAETTFNDGHTHFIRGTTGGAVDLPGGGHIHYFEGYTTVNGRHPHSHAYHGRTGNELF
ncbi:YmaF family protein [Cohnella sp. REN36]|uniref:YmaF family protein n=1 Tax=Cohnella sp. REN36 TaxID=2887347 RepID=UPI001D138259|nr:YmaF family protein [Cohnella sp. REN36]MCC3373647.1 YmaF family protein [Cohnella sp. REN36]